MWIAGISGSRQSAAKWYRNILKVQRLTHGDLTSGVEVGKETRVHNIFIVNFTKLKNKYEDIVQAATITKWNCRIIG